MNYSDVRRWWSTLNDRGFICPVEKWSIVWSNWPIEYFWVFLNIFQYFWIFLRISDYFLVFLNMFEDFWIFFRCFVEKRSTLSDPVDRSPFSLASIIIDFWFGYKHHFLILFLCSIFENSEWPGMDPLDVSGMEIYPTYIPKLWDISRILHSGNQLMKLSPNVMSNEIYTWCVIYLYTDWYCEIAKCSSLKKWYEQVDMTMTMTMWYDMDQSWDPSDILTGKLLLRQHLCQNFDQFPFWYQWNSIFCNSLFDQSHLIYKTRDRFQKSDMLCLVFFFCF